VGIEADPGRQGGLVRDAAQRRRVLTGPLLQRLDDALRQWLTCVEYIRSKITPMTTIGATQCLTDTPSFILPRTRVHPNAKMAQMNTSKMSPSMSAS
jgi:hypothetical protein